MTTPLRLVLFDVDGTLVDSQGAIVTAMGQAFAGAGLAAPERVQILSIVGLSLDRAMAVLAPDQPGVVRAALVEGYKTAFMQGREEHGVDHAPLYPGARDLIDQLAARDDLLLGVATGKSQRGLDGLLQAHGLTQVFVTRQVADHHPSKPHPSMIQTAMAECGVGPADTVMIGDTSYDMDMAQAAGVAGVGVSWGYHPVSALRAAWRVIGRFDELPAALDEIWTRGQA